MLRATGFILPLSQGLADRKMKNAKWLFLSIIMAFIGVPLLVNIITIIVGGTWACISVLENSIPVARSIEEATIIPVALLGAGLIFLCGRIWGKGNASEVNPEWRDCCLLMPALVVLMGWVILMFLTDLNIHAIGRKPIAQVVQTLWLVPSVISFFNGWVWAVLLIPVGSQLCFALGYGGARWGVLRGGAGYTCRNLLVICLLFFGSCAVYQSHLYAVKYPAPESCEYLYFRDYQAHTWGNKLTGLRDEPTLLLTQNWPRLDGATAGLPLYASAFYALTRFPDDICPEDYLENQGTIEAYQNILNGNADLIFVAQPSTAQKQLAEASGVKLVYTPFAREAFVFIVNQNNPVSSLSDVQIRGIFSGRITHWNEVGGEAIDIKPWQRPENSGSQTAMLAKVMKETKLMPAQTTSVATAMGEMVDIVAEYRNTHNAIGYTFRYYATQMHSNKEIKLLAINDVAPTVENIRNGSYPYTVDVYMVTREHPTAETQKLVDWFLSPQGQQLVQDVGYVPLYPAAK
ncbi:PstS family phosphate ABC transporter substrate-binding protein [Salmonella enterica]